jgi:hypothetical protein
MIGADVAGEIEDHGAEIFGKMGRGLEMEELSGGAGIGWGKVQLAGDEVAGRDAQDDGGGGEAISGEKIGETKAERFWLIHRQLIGEGKLGEARRELRVGVARRLGDEQSALTDDDAEEKLLPRDAHNDTADDTGPLADTGRFQDS